MMDIYRVGDDSVKISGDKFNLKPNDHFKGKSMIKIQIESIISDEITPKDVLESIKNLTNLEAEKVIRIKGKDYMVSFFCNDSDVFILGETISQSFSVVDQFLGTIHVSSFSPT